MKCIPVMMGSMLKRCQFWPRQDVQIIVVIKIGAVDSAMFSDEPASCTYQYQQTHSGGDRIRMLTCSPLDILRVEIFQYQLDTLDQQGNCVGSQQTVLDVEASPHQRGAHSVERHDFAHILSSESAGRWCLMEGSVGGQYGRTVDSSSSVVGAALILPYAT